MGATVTTGKLATAFKAASGALIYVLFEETYEKNCHPHTPHWSCVFIGPLDATIRRIFSHASVCEGGMLQNRKGAITPEGYIAGWLKELACPVVFTNQVLELDVGESFYSPIQTKQLEPVKDVLSSHGRQALLDHLQREQGLCLDLHKEGELVAALCAEASLSPWRIIRSSAPTSGARDPGLGYAPAPAAFEVAVPAFLKVDAENRLVQRPDGTWYCGGWEYSIVGGYVQDLWETELREPGSYRKRIGAYRNAIKSALPLPEGVRVAVDTTVPLDHDSQRDKLWKLRAALPVTLTATGYEILVTQDSDLLWTLTHLPAACTSWILPEPAQLQLA